MYLHTKQLKLDIRPIHDTFFFIKFGRNISQYYGVDLQRQEENNNYCIREVKFTEQLQQKAGDVICVQLFTKTRSIIEL